MSKTKATREREIRTRIDCRDRTAQDTLAALVPIWRAARVRGRNPIVVVAHLELLRDSVARFLKGVERLAGEFDARIILEDPSGLAGAFRNALSGTSRFDLRPAR